MMHHQVELSVAKSIVEHRAGHRKKSSKGTTVSGKSRPTEARSGTYVVRWLIDGKKNEKAVAPRTKASSRIVSQRQRDSEGKLFVYRFVDANSASFGADFDKVFRSNVRKARRANKRISIL